MKDEIKNLKQSQLHKLRVQVEHLKNDIKFWHEKYEKNLPYEKTIAKKDRQIAELEKENKELKTGLKRISDKLDVVKKDWREHESLDKLREQKLANAKNETLDKVVAEIDKKLKTCIAYDINPNPEVMEMFDDMYAFMQEQLNDLKSAILAMKKETKT